MQHDLESRLLRLAADEGWVVELRIDRSKYKAFRYQIGPVIGLGHDRAQAVEAAAFALRDLGRWDDV